MPKAWVRTKKQWEASHPDEPMPEDWERSKDDWKGRKEGTYQWFEIQDPVDYWEEFEKPKIVYQEITWRLNFSLDDSKSYLNNTAWFLTTCTFRDSIHATRPG